MSKSVSIRLGSQEVSKAAKKIKESTNMAMHFFLKIYTKEIQIIFWTTLVGVGVQSYMLGGELKKKKKTQKN